MNPALTHPTWPARRVVLWGVLWGLFLSAAEFVVLAPLHSTPVLSFLIWWLVIWSLPMWCAVGCALLLIARRFEPRNDWLALAAAGAALGRVRLQELQAQVDPQLLLATLDEVQALYRREPEHADALRERLVEFLRTAVPGLKQRRSTLQAELQLARGYAELQALLPTGRRWTVELPPRLPGLPFPSLLLPILALPARHEAPRLVVKRVDDKLLQHVQGLGRELPAALVQHARACLFDLLGKTARLHANESPQTQLTIELDIATAETESRR